MAGLQASVDQLAPGWNEGVYAGDNIFTYGRNLSFMGDDAFMDAFEDHATHHH